MGINLITGLVGSGKSTVGKILREKGYYVIDTDSISADIINNDNTTRAAFMAKFGVKATDEKGNLSPEIVEKYITDRDTYDWIWYQLSYPMTSILNQLFDRRLRSSEVFVEIPVIYGWVRDWLKDGSWHGTRNFHISVGHFAARCERMCEKYAKDHELYLGGGTVTDQFLWHSRDEVERNKKFVEAFAGVVKQIDERQTAIDGVYEPPSTKTFLYSNDNLGDPENIADAIIKEISC